MNSDTISAAEVLPRQPKGGKSDSGPLDPEAIAALISQILAANEQLQRRLAAAETDLQERAQQAASYMSEARTDALTGLINRRGFDAELARCLAAWEGFGASFSVVLIDVDRFKGLNDKYGHLAGDAVLTDLGRTLRGASRGGDVAARFGGEEFAILLPHADSSGGRLAVERLRRVVQETQFYFEGTFIGVTVSCGATAALKGDGADAILKRCDAALYASKRGGRNMSHWHAGEQILPLFDGGSPVPETAGELKLSILDQACQDLRRRLLEVMWLEREAGV